jgi:hypothetical protein
MGAMGVLIVLKKMEWLARWPEQNNAHLDNMVKVQVLCMP